MTISIGEEEDAKRTQKPSFAAQIGNVINSAYQTIKTPFGGAKSAAAQRPLKPPFELPGSQDSGAGGFVRDTASFKGESRKRKATVPLTGGSVGSVKRARRTSHLMSGALRE